ncbi:AAA family ATPase [Xanthomonas floridensis]|uniref:RecBCD enzyme subunit RecD n=1 Tax=Xanthomonas floridensis TaxID=1843580 RepID=A0ABU5Q2J8_9XANT|nr:AAA family ATPase [Xanthomonas floridensis]MEA5126095.1 AAA family ATPase [Xanthomonas floridensis]MEA5133961.1 AAA family ATPase [Xanthomonas floridensis]
MLAASRWVDQPAPDQPAAADCPLVLEHGLLYLRRYREYERRLALGLQRIAAQSPPPVDAATLAPLFAQLFPQASPLPPGEGARRAGDGTDLPEPSVYQEATGLPEPSAYQEATGLPKPSVYQEATGLPKPSVYQEATGLPEPPVYQEATGLPEPSVYQEATGLPEPSVYQEGAGLPKPSHHQDGTNPSAPGHSPDRQAQAAALALRRTLLLITGGPGTGKTTTIARLLLLRIAQAHASDTPAPRIALAAPTGRAAERMAESLRAAVARAIADGIQLPTTHTAGQAKQSPNPAVAPLRQATEPADPGTSPHPRATDPASPAVSPLPQAGEGARRAGEGQPPTWESLLPTSASTLHRLLGVLPDSPQFRHTADNPLPFDLIVVDEASMVDLPLMCKLVEAVADGTQLILLGDADQLPSVEAGDVLAAILQAAGPGDALQPDDAHALQPLLGNPPAATTPTATHRGGLAGHRVHLLRGYRQAHDFALAPLADAIRAGDADTTLALLRSGELAGVHFHEDGEDPLTLGRDALLAHWRALADAQDPAAALRDAARLRLLTAVRAGPQGARGLNARIEQLLADTGSGARRLGSASPWFQGRLLLITENSYRHGLFNGDVGICLRSEASPFSGRSEASRSPARSDETPSSGPSQSGDIANRDGPTADRRAQGPLVAWFEGDGDGQVRGFHPAALPAHESAFAMTVHKAQGSEFDTVWLQLPTRAARVLSRELLYTGITRARRALHLAGSEAVIRSALARHAARISGLAWRLGGEQVRPAAEIAQDLPEAPVAPMQGSLF